MYFEDEKKEAINNYLNKSMMKKVLYIGRGSDIAEAFSEYINASYLNKDEKYGKLVKTLWRKDTAHINKVFEGRKYGALEFLLGGERAEDFKDIWNRSVHYIYSTGYLRRSYKTNKSSELYMERNIYRLEEYVYLAAIDFSLDKYLVDNKAEYKDVSVIADIIAVEIDKNNHAVLDRIKEIIYSDNNTAIVTREIIKGLLMSKNVEAHKIIGELLLAAKLQEGLRQAIVENLDEGSREAFIYILKLIIDNNLMRFSSVVRAFGTWIGLALDIDRPKVVKKCFEAAYNCLLTEDYKKQCIDSGDNLLIYIGIWSVAFDEIEDIKEILYKLLAASEKYKKLVALQFLFETQFMVFKHQTACSVLDEGDFEVLALAIKNMFGDLNAYSLRHDKEALKVYLGLEDLCYGMKLFNKLETILKLMPKKEVHFKGSVFPWVDFKLTTDEIMEKMILSVSNTNNSEVVDKLIDYKEKMNPDTRQIFIEVFLKKPSNTKQRLALIEACGDRSVFVREIAFKIVDSLALTRDDYLVVEDLLRYKSGDLRKSAVKLLLKQKGKELENTINILLKSSSENKRLAAIELVSAIEGKAEHKDIYKQCTLLVNTMNNVSKAEKLLTENIISNTEEVKNHKNGYGLYDRDKEYKAPVIEKPANFQIKERFSLTYDELYEILNKFKDLIHENRDFEYEIVNWDDTRTQITLGGSDYLKPFDTREFGLDNYPIADKIREFAKTNNLEAWKLTELNFCIDIINGLRYKSYKFWFATFLKCNFNFKMLKKSAAAIYKIDYYEIIVTYINLLAGEISQAEKFEIGKTVSKHLYTVIPPKEHCEEFVQNNNNYFINEKELLASSFEIGYWLDLMNGSCRDDKDFTDFFHIAYNYYKASKYNARASLTLESFGRALKLNLIDDNEVYKEFFERPFSPYNISELTSLHKYDRNGLSRYTRLIKIGSNAVDTITQIEAKRGELNTEVSHLAASIKKCNGVSIFTSIILALEKDTYVRGYNFIDGDCTKKQMLSHLLKCCYPKDGEDYKTLEESLQGVKVSDKQLIEAAMYSPQWLDIVSKYIKFEGLKSTCWYFHAHVNDIFSNEKASIVARYTPIAIEDLKDGAFDQKWFTDAYNTLGEKKFKLVYDSAKYITGGGLHRRSQLFADATLGRLDINEIKKRVMDKRNKDYLLTYSLIPVKDKKDVLERYEYIHEYVKESKQFGSQRQASEGRSAQIALLNLARNAGYSDVNRLTWNMETERIHIIKPFLMAHKLGDVEIQLAIDELGQTEILCTKDGKKLKIIPARHKNNEYVQEIKVLKRSLKDQYIRAKKSFEIAMENKEIFSLDELSILADNPVIAPIFKNLVFKAGNNLGYIKDNGLLDYGEGIYKLKQEDEIIIAHPIDLYNAGCWSNYQRDIFTKRIVQPFKQVFRELYLPNADEIKEKTLSRRYAGHQVQPKKTLALLKTRGWTVSNEEGLQKVYYRENIIATIYAAADWFSPADIEAPAIEFVRFEDRKTFNPVTIDKVPDIIFSEVMRDIDLVVSVAHVGGVDPEASLSTLEIRTVIVDELLKLMKLSNVSLKGTHAHIKGVHGEYTVHLGSGVVHKMGKGSINILAVHSHHRGRLFLPFIDSDPKSAEILSKIIFLAEDGNIKDPSILEQITS